MSIMRRKPERMIAVAVTAFTLLTPACDKKSELYDLSTKKCEHKVVDSVNRVTVRKGTCEVRTGDSLLKVEFTEERAGVMDLQVVGVDDKGISIKSEMEIFMSEHHGKIERVAYGETKRFDKVTITPKKRTSNGAILTIQ